MAALHTYPPILCLVGFLLHRLDHLHYVVILPSIVDHDQVTIGDIVAVVAGL